MSKALIICHVVFATKAREKTINPEHKKDLYAYIYSILKSNKCWVYRLNGVEDHIHLLFDLSPSISLSKIMQEIKANSSRWLRENSDFRYFKGWGKGYFAVSVSPEAKESVRTYILNQETHHKGESSIDEIKRMIKMYEMEWYPDEWS